MDKPTSALVCPSKGLGTRTVRTMPSCTSKAMSCTNSSVVGGQSLAQGHLTEVRVGAPFVILLLSEAEFKVVIKLCIFCHSPV